MRNILYILFFSSILLGCLQNNSNKNKEEKLSQNQKISVCKIYTADFVLLDPDDKGLLLQEFRFNKKGFVNELIRYDLNGDVLGKFDIFGEHTPFPMPQ